MNARRIVAKLMIGVMAFCLFAGTALALYRKTISLTGTVTLVYVAPTNAAPAAEEYLQMAFDAFDSSVPLFEGVRKLAKETVYPMIEDE